MPILIASEVMDLAGAALNDVDLTVYDYDTQIPYLKMALQELQEVFELNSLAVTEQSSSEIPIVAGVVELRFNAPSQPRLPDNLIEPMQLWVSDLGTSNWTPMFRKEFFPHTLEGSPSNQLTYWVWHSNKIKFLPANGDNDVKIDYIGSLFPKYVRSDTELPVQNGLGYLSYKTAELIADMVEHNPERAQTNGVRAQMSLDRISGITIKGKQQIVTRRRPFRSAYKRINSW